MEMLGTNMQGHPSALLKKKLMQTALSPMAA